MTGKANLFSAVAIMVIYQLLRDMKCLSYLLPGLIFVILPFSAISQTLESAYAAKSQEMLTDVLVRMASNSVPITPEELKQLGKYEQTAYKIFKTHYRPDQPDRLGLVKDGEVSDEYIPLSKFVVIKDTLNISVYTDADLEVMHLWYDNFLRSYDIKVPSPINEITLTNFNPIVLLDSLWVIYQSIIEQDPVTEFFKDFSFTSTHLTELESDSLIDIRDEKEAFLQQKLASKHLSGFGDYRTDPFMNHIEINESAKDALIFYQYNSALYYTRYEKDEDQWTQKFVKRVAYL